MCIGVPLRVLVCEGLQAWCTRAPEGVEGEPAGEWIDLSLVGPQPPGTWLLGFQGAARQLMTPAEAAQARAGRDALAAVLRGDVDVDAYFADLVGRTPELPAHLRPTENS